jgi:hypothetical protein
MKRVYRCTSCGSAVSPAGQMVVLVGIFGGAQMLIGFHPEPGDYTLFLPPGAELERGDRWSFHCPVCHSSLESGLDENLCALDLEEGGAKKRVLFSRICGEHATFVIAGDTEPLALGEDAELYDTTKVMIVKER